MKVIKIKIRPYNKSNKQDKVMVKLMEEMVNKERDKFDGVVRELTRIQFLLETLHGVVLENKYWEGLFNEVVKLNLKNNIENTLKGGHN